MCDEFFNIVQGYCDLLADFSLVIKMGRNVKKCILCLYNIPQNIPIPEFTSVAWSFDAQGLVKGTIKVIVMQRDMEENLLCYRVPPSLKKNMPQNVQDILENRKYLGVPTNAQLESDEGKKKILNKMKQRIAIISKNTASIQEAKILHNMLVCQVATFSPLCISMSLKECAHIDKHLLSAYQYHLKYMPSDAKHNIFMTVKKGGIGIRSFTREYIGAILRDIEVYISNDQNPTPHALISSIKEATKQNIWNLYRDGKIPNFTTAATKASQISISGKKTLVYYDNAEQPLNEIISFDHVHTMEKAIKTTIASSVLY